MNTSTMYPPAVNAKKQFVSITEKIPHFSYQHAIYVIFYGSIFLQRNTVFHHCPLSSKKKGTTCLL